MLVLEQIRTEFSHLSDAKQKVAAHILQHWQEVAFLSVSQLARAATVSESVVVRFANDMGYSGYPDLQEEIRGMVRAKLGLVAMYKRSADENGGETRQMVERVLSNDVHNLTRTLEDLDSEELERTVDQIIGARRIVVLAARSSAGPGRVLAMYLNSVLGSAQFLSDTDGDIYDHLRTMGEQDVAIGISFAWYTRRTIDEMEYCRARGIRTIAITDNLTSPLAKIASTTLSVHSEGVSFYVSQVATLGLVNVLLYLVANRSKDRAVQSLGEMEHLYNRFYVPHKPDRR